MTTAMNAAGWRRIENENGFSFYLNSNDKQQWDHPKYNEIKLRLDDCNYIKFASYRVAYKFRALQSALFMNDVPLSIIKGVFERHKLGPTENTLFLESCDLEAVLSDIYFAANKQNHTNVDVETATELMLNFIYNIFDPDRKTHVEVLPSKLTLAILSNCPMNELIHFIFTLCSDHNNCVTRLRLQTILSKLCLVTNYLHETISFGPHLINASIEECFNNSPGLVGIDETTFAAWLESAPQIFAWLSILHRIKLSEALVHKAKCSVCKTHPIIGMKYKCVKCTKYVQCQRCFLTGRISHAHKLTHVMKEHCKENLNHLKTRFTNRVFKLLKCKYRVCDDRQQSKHLKEVLLRPHEEVDCKVEPLSSPLSQLQVIIRQLEIENKQLQEILHSSNKNEQNIKRFVEEHRQNVASQVQKLKVLKEYMSNSEPPTATATEQFKREVIQSTPMVQNGKSIGKPMLRGMDLFSPIPQQSNVNSNEYSNDSNIVKKDDSDYSSLYTMNDISTWLGGQPPYCLELEDDKENTRSKATSEQTDLDDALAKLQLILANNFSLDETDNCQLKTAVNEVEGVLSSIIDNAEEGNPPNSFGEGNLNALSFYLSAES